MSEETTTTTEATATTTESTSTAPGIFGDGLAFREGWYNDVQDPTFDQYRSMAAQYKDLPTVFKSLHDTKAALSQRQDGMVKLPNPQSTPEEIAAYRKATGVPDTLEGYEIKIPEKLPEGVEFQPEVLNSFKEFAHKAGIPLAVANELIAFQAQAESAQIARFHEESAAEAKASEASLRAEWGGQYEQKDMLARRAAQTFGLGANHPALQDPAVRKALANAGAAISEDKLASAEKVSPSLTPGNEAKDIMKNPDNPLHAAYHDPSHPNHEHAYRVYMEKLKEQVKREGHQV